LDEIGRVILELKSVRDLLHNEGEHISREIAGYASLSHAATTAINVIAGSLKRWATHKTISGIENEALSVLKDAARYFETPTKLECCSCTLVTVAMSKRSNGILRSITRDKILNRRTGHWHA